MKDIITQDICVIFMFKKEVAVNKMTVKIFEQLIIHSLLTSQTRLIQYYYEHYVVNRSDNQLV